MPSNEENGNVKRLRVTLVKSGIGYSQRQKGTIKALGLRKLGSAVEVSGTPEILGMLAKIPHLIRVEEAGE
jgi:large subunit ribosomal protein L30